MDAGPALATGARLLPLSLESSLAPADSTAQGYRLLLTGGYGEHFNTTSQPNAYYAQRLLLDMGVAAEHILELAESRNTVDDALKSRPIVDKYGGDHLIIVSSDFHLGRVQFVFERVFPDKRVEFLGAPYLESRAPAERERLVAHEARELKSLQERGESIVGGALRLDSWKRSVKSIEV